jgi:hypothetical protein
MKHIVKSLRSYLRLRRIQALRNARYAAACGAFALAGCSIGVQDAAKAQAPLSLSVGDQACLETAIPVVQSYFQGQATAADVNGAWDCANKAITMFETYTRGSQGTTYSPSELRSFIETYFLSETKISDAMLNQVMIIKQTVVGGDLDKITHEDLENFKDVLNELKSQTLKLLPFVRILTMDMSVGDAQANPQLVEGAITQVTASINELGTYLGKAKQNYDFDDLKTLVKEFKKISPAATWPDFIISHLTTISIAKSFFIKAPGDVLAPTEWKDLASVGGRLYSLYLRTTYLMAGRDLLNGLGLDQLTESMAQLFDVLDAAVKLKPDGVIHYTDIDALIKVLVDTKLINWPGVRATTLHDLVHNILEQIFTQPDSTGGRLLVDGVDQGILDKARKGFMGWIDMQRVWRDLVAKAVAANPALAGKPIPAATVKALWKTFSSPYAQPFADFQTVFDRKQPLSFSKEGFVIFSKAKDVTYDQVAFDSLNWKMHFARAISLGFGADPTGYEGLSTDEFHAFFLKAHDLAMDLQFVKPDDTTIWSKVFTESNMFLLSSDANAILSFQEGIDFISYAMAGTQILRPLYHDVRANCQNLAPDVFGDPTIEIGCFRERFRLNFATNTVGLPNWVKMASELNTADFNQMELNLEKVGRAPIGPERIEESEIDKMVMLMQYIETLYTRFDKNNSQTLSFTEALGVYPMFRSILAKQSGLTSESDLQGLFAYILAKKKPPTSIIDKLYFKFIWLNQKSEWNKIQASRLDLLDIIGQLAAGTGL